MHFDEEMGFQYLGPGITVLSPSDPRPPTVVPVQGRKVPLCKLCACFANILELAQSLNLLENLLFPFLVTLHSQTVESGELSSAAKSLIWLLWK